MLTACHFTGWDQPGKGDPCIRAAGGRLMVNGCEFMDEGKHAIILEKGLKAATILGCTFRGPQAIDGPVRRRRADRAQHETIGELQG